jgi:pimeloyl-ACP methyl ester carboxylesterase
MKKIFYFLSLLLIAAQLQGKEQGVCWSSFDNWVEEKSEKLLANHSQTIMTFKGPVQYAHEDEGFPVLILHGAFGGIDQAQLVSDYLRKEGFSTLTVSRPGYLGTPLPELPPSTAFTPADQAAVLIALLDELKISKVAVIGYFAGAPIAYALAKNYPERIAALVLESIGASPSEDFLYYSAFWSSPTQLSLNHDFVAYLLQLSQRFDFDSSLKEALLLDTSLTGAPLYDRIRYTEQHQDKYNFLKRLLSTMIPISPRLPGILNDFLGQDYWTTHFDPTGMTIPTLLIQAVNDANGYFPIAQQIQQQLPNAQLFPIPSSGHFLWFGPETKAWQKKVVKFLEEHSH